MTQQRVPDELYGAFSRKVDELRRRIDEGTLDFWKTMNSLQCLIEGGKAFPAPESVLDKPVQVVLDLTVRARMPITRLRIETVRQLVDRTASDLSSQLIPTFGERELNEIRQRLAEVGLHLKGE